MTRRYLRHLGLLVLLVLTGSPAIAQSGRFDLEKTKRILSPMIEQLLADHGIPSMSIALVRGDSIVWKAAFGYANMRTRTPATTETLYSTGSSGKSLTAAAVMQLVDQGKIRLDDPINRYLGNSPVKDTIGKPVTFTHILSHWSGLNSGARTQPIWSRRLPNTLEVMTSELYSIRAPETRYAYNNFAYGTAGLLVQNISGVEYEKYIVDNILKPVGATTEHPIYPSPEMVERMALPYKFGGSLGKPEPEPQVHFDVYPAGDIYLRAEDMARFLGAQLNGGVFNGKRILSEQSVRAMHTPRFGGDYGFGYWMIRDSTTGDTLIHHGGAIAGQRAFMIGDIKARVGVYYMTNSDFLPDSRPPSELTDAALKLLRGEDYAPRPRRQGIAVNDRVLDTYVGTYEVVGPAQAGGGRGGRGGGGTSTIVVSRVGRALAIQQGNQSAKYELVAESPTRFVQRGTGTIVTFKGDSIITEMGRQRRAAARRGR